MATHTAAYRKAYMANLQTETKANHKNLVANKGSPAAHQYMQYSGQSVLGVSTFTPAVSSKGTKGKGHK